MQTRKEVNEMHAVITRAVALTPILAAVAAILLGLGLAPIEPSTMPGPICPPQC